MKDDKTRIGSGRVDEDVSKMKSAGAYRSIEAQRKKFGKDYGKEMSRRIKLFWASKKGKERRKQLSTGGKK